MKDFRKSGGFGAGKKGGFDRRDDNNFGSKFGGGYNKYQGGNGNVRPEGQVKHQATCAECGNMCEVPFRPNGKKPVFCADCFGGKRDAGMKTFRDRKEFTPRTDDRAHAHQAAPAKDHRIDELKAQVSALGAKLDRIISMMEREAPVKAAPVEAPKASEEKKAKPVAKAAVKAAPKKAAKPAAKKPAAKASKKK